MKKGRDPFFRCYYCNQFVSYRDMDIAIPYGCSDPNDPEPLDEEVYCGKCAKAEYQKALKAKLGMDNYWQKPNFQLKAMKKLGIIEKDYRLVYAP